MRIHSTKNNNDNNSNNNNRQISKIGSVSRQSLCREIGDQLDRFVNCGSNGEGNGGGDIRNGSKIVRCSYNNIAQQDNYRNFGSHNIENINHGNSNTNSHTKNSISDININIKNNNCIRSIHTTTTKQNNQQKQHTLLQKIMNMPNNIPVPKDTNINTDKVKDKGKDKDVKKNGKNLSIVIQGSTNQTNQGQIDGYVLEAETVGDQTQPRQQDNKMIPQYKIQRTVKNTHQNSLHRTSSNNSIISQLELQQFQTYQQKNQEKQKQRQREREKLIIKICDGIYIGGVDSIWDVDTMELNYVTHLVRVCEDFGEQGQDSRRNGSCSKQKQNKSKNNSLSKNNSKNKKTQNHGNQQYVPSIVSYIHTISYNYNSTSYSSSHTSDKNSTAPPSQPISTTQQKSHKTLLQTYKKLNMFIEHARQAGESCLIIMRDSSSSLTLQTQYSTEKKSHFCSNKNQHCESKQKSIYDCVFDPAVLVCGYLMYRFSWSMLKSIQFLSSRIEASYKTTQLLTKINNKLSQSNPSTNSHSHSHNSHNNTIYSQIVTHMLPELPHSKPNQSHQQLYPNVNKIRVGSLELLENLILMGQNRKISYGWYAGGAETKNSSGSKSKEKVKDKNLYSLNNYNLQANQLVDVLKQQQLVLTNTYINSTMGGNMSYTSVLQSQSKSKYYEKSLSLGTLKQGQVKSKGKDCRSQIQFKNFYINGSSKQNNSSNTLIRRSLKILPNKNYIHTKQPNNKNPRTSTDQNPNINVKYNRLKNSSQKDKQFNMSKSLQLRQQSSNEIQTEEENMRSSLNKPISYNSSCSNLCKINKSINLTNFHNDNLSRIAKNRNVIDQNKGKVKNKDKRVSWAGTLTTVHKQQEYYKQICKNNASSKNKSKDKGKQIEILEQYANDIKNKYQVGVGYAVKNSGHGNTNTNTNTDNSPEKQSQNITKTTQNNKNNKTSIISISDKKTLKTKPATFNSSNRSKIVLNVINIMNRHSEQTTQRTQQSTQNHQKFAHTNKKSLLYQSKAKIPTMQDLHDVLVTNTDAPHAQIDRHEQNLNQGQYISNMKSSSIDKNENKDNRLKIEIDTIQSQGNCQYYKSKDKHNRHKQRRSTQVQVRQDDENNKPDNPNNNNNPTKYTTTTISNNSKQSIKMHKTNSSNKNMNIKIRHIQTENIDGCSQHQEQEILHRDRDRDGGKVIIPMNSMNGMNRRNIIINNTINRLKEIKGSSGSGNGNTKISVGQDSNFSSHYNTNTNNTNNTNTKQ